MESPTTPSIDSHGRPLIERPTASSIGRTAGAIEYVTIFNGASETEAKAIESIDLIALTCRTISSDMY